MTEYPPQSTGEHERHDLRVGDVILFTEEAKRLSFNRQYLVTTVYESGQLEAMALPDDDHSNYGSPGTENAEGIKEVIDHFTLDKTAECLARAFVKDPAPDFVEKMARILREEASADNTP